MVPAKKKGADPPIPSSINGSDDSGDDGNLVAASAASTETSGGSLFLAKAGDSTFKTGMTASVSSVGGDDDSEDRYDEIEAVKQMAHKEHLRVRQWRMLVILAMLGAAIGVTWNSYNYLVDADREAFEAAFRDSAETLQNAALDHARQVANANAAMANIYSGYALNNNRTWPFVTLPKFEAYGADFRERSRLEALWLVSIVTHKDRDAFEDYIEEVYEEAVASDVARNPAIAELWTGGGYSHDLRAVSAGAQSALVTSPVREEYAVLWQQTPPPLNYRIINYDLLGVPDYVNAMDVLKKVRRGPVITRVRPFSASSVQDHATFHSQNKDDTILVDHPHSFVFHPIYAEPDDPESGVVSALISARAWDVALRKLLPSYVEGVVAVVRNNCNQSYTYEVVGPEAFLMGEGDLHDPKYDSTKTVVDMNAFSDPEFTEIEGHCLFHLDFYASEKFESRFNTGTARHHAIVVALTFACMISFFFMYDVFVQRRNMKVIQNAARSNALVTSMFPNMYRDRLLGVEEEEPSSSGGGNFSRRKSMTSLKSWMTTENVGTKGVASSGSTDRPLADLFLDTTVMFTDIVGFTAWSSIREPSQVFLLLETLYARLDQIAKQYKVYKVETVGDCYVAVTGLPEPRADHAVLMIKFARTVLHQRHTILSNLEVILGPDTGDLSLRIGIHSGPVTGGILRGERARFQLFGDTMNVTARVESSGEPNRIHVSEETAILLRNAGRSAWLTKRDSPISIKGKGDMQTYFITTSSERVFPKDHRNGSVSSIVDEECDSPAVIMQRQKRRERLVEWNVTILIRMVKEIVALRKAKREHQTKSTPATTDKVNATDKPFEEVVEIIMLPPFDAQAARRKMNPEEVVIDPVVHSQLTTLVSCIGNMYRENAFHSFEHASHVVMSVIKLLSRIVAPTDFEEQQNLSNSSKLEASLHDHTYGITSDPLTRFACAFSALIHDVDHRGVPNAQLIKEEVAMANLYENRSVAEQNSVVLAWNVFMDPQFAKLRSLICPTTQELRRFRELVVNSVMATDIVDKELKEMRNARWDKAFAKNTESVSTPPSSSAIPASRASPSLSHSLVAGDTINKPSATTWQTQRENVNRKATVVIEHLIQASDVSHTMQHWHVYRKWNESFFRECYAAYRAGRAEKDPIDSWYKGELGFFDFYIIPLAKKLKDCGVFGKSSDEYLNYAMRNRAEWETRGQGVLAEMVENVMRQYERCADRSRSSDDLNEDQGKTFA